MPEQRDPKLIDNETKRAAQEDRAGSKPRQRDASAGLSPGMQQGSAAGAILGGRRSSDLFRPR